jgi:hypothetical protein
MVPRRIEWKQIDKSFVFWRKTCFSFHVHHYSSLYVYDFYPKQIFQFYHPLPRWSKINLFSFARALLADRCQISMWCMLSFWPLIIIRANFHHRRIFYWYRWPRPLLSRQRLSSTLELLHHLNNKRRFMGFVDPFGSVQKAVIHGWSSRHPIPHPVSSFWK